MKIRIRRAILRLQASKIGWQQKKLVTAMTEHSTELHLTLKKRPRHINILGEVIILRPYRIPSKKTANKCHKWSEDKLCNPDTCSTSNESDCIRDDFIEDEDDSAFLPASEDNLALSKDASVPLRLYAGPSSATVQRRATVSGASPTLLKPPVSIEDLVNGVPNVKTGDSFVRSISHDPAGLKKSLKPNSVFSEKITFAYMFASNSTEEKEKPEKISLEINQHSAVKYLQTTDGNHLSTNNSNGACHNKSKSPIPMLETLPVHEEDYAVLENKSLSRTNNCIVLQKYRDSDMMSSEKEEPCSTDEVCQPNAERINPLCMILDCKGLMKALLQENYAPTMHESSLTEKTGIFTTRSPDLSPIKREWEIIERQQQRHPQPE
ncbi:connector enhancer of kinase suppressor of ras 2 [Trichonephila clavipes]|nr:connector enhancer of kinase suppressor of ras 2 [Trichonephila clavipes]